MISERNRYKRQYAPVPVPEFEHGQGYDQNQEEIQKSPPLKPCAGHHIHASRCEETPTGWQI